MAASKPLRAVVIGGGLLGLEAAYGLAKAGAQTTVVHLMDRLMERQLDPIAANLLQANLMERGLSFRLNAHSKQIVGTDHVEGLELADGEILPADIVVMAVGIRPQSALAKASGVDVNRGIVVDDGLETNVPGVYAIGECAEHRGIAYGLVEPAYEQARVLAARLAQHEAVYAGSLTSTNLKVSGVNLFSAGDFLGEAGTQVIVSQDRGSNTYRKFVLQTREDQDYLVGCLLYGDVTDALWYLDLIRQSTPLGAMRQHFAFGRALVSNLAA